MSSANGSIVPKEASEIADKGKGKGKSVDQTPNHDMMVEEEEEDTSEEESGVEEDHGEAEEEDEDNLEEIDEANIISTGRRTRGKNINWAEADQKSKEAGDELEDDDEEDDEDFEAEDDKMEE